MPERERRTIGRDARFFGRRRDLGGPRGLDDGAVLPEDLSVADVEERIEKTELRERPRAHDEHARLAGLGGNAKRVDAEELWRGREEQGHAVRREVLEDVALRILVEAHRDACAPRLLVPSHRERRLRRHALLDVAADRRPVHERQVRVIEHVLHRARPVCAPVGGEVRAVDVVSEERVGHVRLDVGCLARRRVDPDQTADLARRQRRRAERLALGVGVERHVGVLARAVEGPSVERALDATRRGALAERERRAAMRAPVDERRGLPLAVAKEDDALARERERDERSPELFGRHHRRPDVREILEHVQPPIARFSSSPTSRRTRPPASRTKLAIAAEPEPPTTHGTVPHARA